MKEVIKKELLAVIGDKIKKSRIARGWSQEDFAAYVQISRAYYGRIENGKFNFSISKLMEIATYLEIEPKELCPNLDELSQLLSNKFEESTSSLKTKKKSTKKKTN